MRRERNLLNQSPARGVVFVATPGSLSGAGKHPVTAQVSGAAVIDMALSTHLTLIVLLFALWNIADVGGSALPPMSKNPPLFELNGRCFHSANAPPLGLLRHLIDVFGRTDQIALTGCSCGSSFPGWGRERRSTISLMPSCTSNSPAPGALATLGLSGCTRCVVMPERVWLMVCTSCETRGTSRLWRLDPLVDSWSPVEPSHPTSQVARAPGKLTTGRHCSLREAGFEGIYIMGLFKSTRRSQEMAAKVRARPSTPARSTQRAARTPRRPHGVRSRDFSARPSGSPSTTRRRTGRTWWRRRTRSATTQSTTASAATRRFRGCARACTRRGCASSSTSCRTTWPSTTPGRRSAPSCSSRAARRTSSATRRTSSAWGATGALHPRAVWTRHVPLPVLTGHVSSLSPY